MSPLMRPAMRLVLAGLVLSGALIWAAVSHIQAVESGNELVLEAQGFDPRGLLTGHYTEVRYNISSAVQLPRIATADPRLRSDVWVTIEPSESDWQVTAVTVAKPANITANARVVRASAGPLYVATDQDVVNYDLRYGIERIYAQQSEAEAIAALIRPRTDEGMEPRLQVVASLGKDGRLRIKGLIVEGVRRDFKWW